MPEIKEINDKSSPMLPDIEELRENQKEGNEGKGPKENNYGPLNSCQGHEVEIKD